MEGARLPSRWKKQNGHRLPRSRRIVQHDHPEFGPTTLANLANEGTKEKEKQVIQDQPVISPRDEEGGRIDSFPLPTRVDNWLDVDEKGNCRTCQRVRTDLDRGYPDLGEYWICLENVRMILCGGDQARSPTTFAGRSVRDRRRFNGSVCHAKNRTEPRGYCRRLRSCHRAP